MDREGKHMSQEARKVARNFLSMNIAFSKCRPTENRKLHVQFKSTLHCGIYREII